MWYLEENMVRIRIIYLSMNPSYSYEDSTYLWALSECPQVSVFLKEEK
jgi:hypothetical protein